MTLYRLSFNGILHEQSTNALRNRIVQIIEQSDFESLTIIFASEGGSTDQGLSLYNFLRSLPVPIHMHAVGHVGSMAIPVFLAGHKRTCTPSSRFFFHTYDWGFEGRQEIDRITEALKRLESDIKISNEIVAKHTKIPPEQREKFYNNSPTPTIFTPQVAKEVGIVEEITELNPMGITQPGIVLWTVDW
ncbi:MAG: ATP-dependent Clp protease proteolytic subunit [Pseudomonadota bacterium]